MLITMNIWVFLLVFCIVFVAGLLINPIEKITKKIKGDKKKGNGQDKD